MFNNLDIHGRTAAFTAIASVIPREPGPARNRLTAFAELEAGLWQGEAGDFLTPALLRLVAQELGAFAEVAVAMESGWAGFPVLDAAELGAELGDSKAAVLVLRLIGASPSGAQGQGRWEIRAPEDSGQTPIPVPIPRGFLKKLFREFADAFEPGQNDTDTASETP